MMFCFQSPFTRSSRGVVPTVTVSSSQTKSTAPLSTIAATTTSSTTSNMKQSTKSKRRSSGTTSEGSSSSIRYIDHGHSMSSSTDTLPGVKADYLEPERLSSEHTVLTLPSAVDSNDRQNLLLADDNHRGRRSSSSPRSSPTRKSPSSSDTGSSWRRMLPLRLRSTDSSNSNMTSQSSIGEVFSSTTSSPVTSESASFGKGIAQLDYDYRSATPMKISTPPPISVLVEVDDEQQSSRALVPATVSLKDMPSSQTSCSETEEIEDEEHMQKPEGSSLPSSPAVMTVRQVSSTGRKTSSSVKYYDFLSVNGGSIRQDATSTSSPQLSSASSNRSSSESSSCKKSSESHEDRGKTGPDKLKPKANEPNASLPAARSCPNLGINNNNRNINRKSGAKFDPLDEGDIQICYFDNSQTIMKKLLNSKYVRRLEAHHLCLNDADLSSKTRAGFLQEPIPYRNMLEVRKYGGTTGNSTYRNCLSIVLPGGSLLLQASDAYTRDHWYYSILWKKSIFKYQYSVSVSTTSNLVLNELEEMVKFVQDTPVQGERVAGILLEAAAKLLEEPETNGTVGTSEKIRYAWRKETQKDKRRWAEKVLAITAPFLEIAAPPPPLARELARLADLRPTSQLVSTLTPAITRCLKHTVDFSRTPDMRKLIQGFIAALYENEKGEQAVRDYITSIHGPGSDCPHSRVLPNLVSVCLAAISHWYDVLDSNRNTGQDSETLPPVDCYLLVLEIVSEYADWLPGLGALLQPVPLKKDALAMKPVQESILLCVMRRIARDPRCSVHKVVLPVRESQPGWIYIAAPSHPTCLDSGELFGEMLTTLLGCCCRGKGFIESLMQKACNDCMLLAVRGCAAAQEALCLSLEWLLLTNEETRLQVVNALESTDSGKNRYAELCHRQRDLQELQQKGGPSKLTLPVRATDADVATYLAGRPLGNLECLVLAFTSVTSACAEQLIKLPALTYLDLWATQFGDAGLQMISEHLLNLEVLNLCETPVSDRGISTLASLTSLRKLNLNSTKLSAQTFESLRKRLPALQEFDVRYTEAW